MKSICSGGAHVSVVRDSRAWLNGRVHELSIASAILDCVAVEAKKRPNARVVKVGLRVGEISGVDADALSFGFEALTRDTRWESLQLQIQFCPRMQRCVVCTHQFAAPNSETVCPACGAYETECVSGDELDVAFLEMEEP